MPRYVASGSIVGKTCPFCQTPIKPESLVEVCGVCGIPHHIECWQANQNKCTTFGCSGGQQNFAAQASIGNPIQPQHNPNACQMPADFLPPVKAENSAGKWVIGITVAVIGIGFLIVQSGVSGGNKNTSTQSANYPGAPPPSYSSSHTTPSSSPSYKPPPPLPRSIIMGNEVILRASHTVASNEVAYLNRGDRVDVIDRWTTKESNEGILTRGNLTLAHNGKQVVLQKGQAVGIVRETSALFVIVIKVDGQWLEKTADKDMITRIYGQNWLQVRLQNGRIGWILSKFVQEN